MSERIERSMFVRRREDGRWSDDLPYEIKHWAEGEGLTDLLVIGMPAGVDTLEDELTARAERAEAELRWLQGKHLDLCEKLSAKVATVAELVTAGKTLLANILETGCRAADILRAAIARAKELGDDPAPETTAYVECRHCGGVGKLGVSQCRYCKGTGVMAETKEGENHEQA